ncbi:unnamed protein product [Meganyctiphanes norvegica]|uniref:Gamma-butyrobetaine dioxygenase n=1 Tax=Meganyctiphanes norvegica TaxID=48144 RepID=A0AAV2Q2N1_MEGNR
MASTQRSAQLLKTVSSRVLASTAPTTGHSGQMSHRVVHTTRPQVSYFSKVTVQPYPQSWSSVRRLSLAAQTRQQELAASRQPVVATSVLHSQAVNDAIRVEFADGSKSDLAHLWLRDNCQCEKCYSKSAQGRISLLKNLDLNTHPVNVQEVQNGSIIVEWNDGHISEFSGEWLHQRAFNPTSRQKRRNQYALKKVPCGGDFRPKVFEYCNMLKDDQNLLDWHLAMERDGFTLIRNAPDKDVAGPELIEHIAVVKQSHYGPHSPVVVRADANNIAWTNSELGLHNDLAQYEYMAGIIFIHCKHQHVGSGGESLVSDGLYAAEELRRHHPEAFKLLTTTDNYYWDKGVANLPWEQEEFFKIARMPVIKLDNNQEVIQVAVNNAVRDSYLDLPAHKVKQFYEAMKIYNDILYENAITFKMAEGDMIVLDNIRCLHGRLGYEAHSTRHLESSYLDWDEARCRRRRLQEKLGVE